MLSDCIFLGKSQVEGAVHDSKSVFPAVASENAVRVSFSLPYHCDYGQTLSISGSHKALGQWDLSHCVDMTWNDGDIWRAALSLPAR